MTDASMTTRLAYPLLVLSRHPAGLSMRDLGGGFTKADRELLVGKGLVSASRTGSRLVVTLSDRGWRWLSDDLSRLFDPDAQPLRDRALGIYVTAVAGYLARRGIPYSEVASDAIGEVPAGVDGRSTPRSGDEAEAHDPDDARAGASVGERIRRAYLEVTGGRRDEYVTIASLRARMPDLARPEVDEALRDMQRQAGDFAMTDMENRSAASREVEEGACTFEGRVMHLARIAS